MVEGGRYIRIYQANRRSQLPLLLPISIPHNMVASYCSVLSIRDRSFPHFRAATLKTANSVLVDPHTACPLRVGWGKRLPGTKYETSTVAASATPGLASQQG